MPNKPISMTKIRQVLRCYSQGRGSKQISYLLCMSRTTVKKYLRIYQSSGKSLEEIMELPDNELFLLFREAPSSPRPDVLTPRQQELQDFIATHIKRLKRKGVTKEMLYNEYRSSSSSPFCRSQFMHLFRRHQVLLNPVAHIEHKAGDKLYIDFAGNKLRSLADPATGELIETEVFVCILPCSQLTYVESCLSQKKEDLIRCCENALRFYGGTPSVIVPDNLKSAVTRHGRYESELNEDFASFAEHHGITVMPARVRRPKDKALVEDAVKLTYRQIYTRLEGLVFHDLESLNKAIGVALEIHNNAPMTGGRPSRRQQYEDIERECMGALNPIRFELKRRHTATVQNNGHVRIEKSFYSVPTKYIGCKLNVIYDNSVVRIYSRSNELIAEHRRSHRLFEYVTQLSHLPKNQQKMLTWDPADLLREAGELHPDLVTFLEHVINEKKYPEQAYKSCRGIMSLLPKIGLERLLKACRLAASSGMFNYLAVASIVKNKQDELPVEDWGEIDEGRTTPDHENVRGKEYYK